MSEAKRIIGTIANGLKDGDEFHFHYFDKPVGCQITSWNGENDSASCINIWMDGSTSAYISNGGMSNEYAALIVVQTIVEHVVEKDYGDGKAHQIHAEFWKSIETDPWLNAIWMENADNRKKEEEE